MWSGVLDHMYTPKNQTYPHVYGISGQKRHGKDTFAKILIREGSSQNLSFTITHFAGELKRQASIVFGLSKEQLDGSLKESPLDAPIEMDQYLDTMRRESGLQDMQPAGMVAHTPREVMQYLGTEYVRRTKDSYWIDVVLNKISQTGGFSLIPDTRFVNEADAVRSVGGKVIRINRLDLPMSKDGHSSETEMNKIDPDLLLGTITDNFYLQSQVSKLIVKGNFEEAQKYDYRKISRALAEYKGGATTRDVADMLGIDLANAELVLSYYKVSCEHCLGYRYFDKMGCVWRGQVTEVVQACTYCNQDAETKRLS